MGMAANALYGAERFRRAAGTPGVEYGLEIGIGNLGGELPVGGYTGRAQVRLLGPFPGGILFSLATVSGRQRIFGRSPQYLGGISGMRLATIGTTQ